MPIQTHIHWIKAAVRHYLKASTRYDIHSPFLAKWIEEVYEDDRWFETFGLVIGVRDYWKHSDKKVSYKQDPGAGSRAGQGPERSVKQMVKYSAVDAVAGQLLFRMANFHKPNTILELGTNLGFSAMYIRGARRNAHFISIEAQKQLVELAKKSFDMARLPLPNILAGTFQEQLPTALAELKEVDFFWIDGDHRSEATIDYVKQVLPFLSKQGVVVIGDIHWSADMEKAWESLKKLPQFSLSLDVFHFGILFLREEQKVKEHFSLLPYWMKPWRMGLF